MKQFDNILKTYADSGLRSAEDWLTMGRDIDAGMKPRLDTLHRGAMLPLYTRGQTHARPRTERSQPVVTSTPTA